MQQSRLKVSNFYKTIEAQTLRLIPELSQTFFINNHFFLTTNTTPNKIYKYSF